MSASRAKQIVTHWDTIRYELMNTRICDLGLKIEGSPVEPLVLRVRREMAAKGLACPRWASPSTSPTHG